MKVIVGCELSQVVTKAFRERGYDAYSYDIIPCEGGHPEWHFQDDIREVMKKEKFDLGIFHPPCTYLCNSGVRWLYEKPGRWELLNNAIDFFNWCFKLPIEKICIENPIMHKHAKLKISKPYSQIIHPWQFGHGETKATCLWLIGLPLLKPTNIVLGRDDRVHRESPSVDRWKKRSITLPGIAKAMASQWGYV